MAGAIRTTTTVESQLERMYNQSVWINVTIELREGGPVSINVNGSPSLMKHIAKESKETGYVILWNDNECLMLEASNVLAIKATKLTAEGE